MNDELKLTWYFRNKSDELSYRSSPNGVRKGPFELLFSLIVVSVVFVALTSTENLVYVGMVSALILGLAFRGIVHALLSLLLGFKGVQLVCTDGTVRLEELFGGDLRPRMLSQQYDSVDFCEMSKSSAGIELFHPDNHPHELWINAEFYRDPGQRAALEEFLVSYRVVGCDD